MSGMYCRKCYASLQSQGESGQCGRCLRLFDPAKPRTYLRYPFPSVSKIVIQVVLTALLGIGAAYVVAMGQLAAASGH